MAVFDKERAVNLYNSNSYEANTNNWEDSTGIYRASAFYKSLTEAGVLGKLRSVLDVGCGSGGVLMELSELLAPQSGKSIKMDGIDLSANAIAIARDLYPNSPLRNVNFFVEMINDKPSSKLYTVASLIHVLEHCPDMQEMLALCEKRAEYLYINVPIEVNIFYSLRKNLLVNQYLKYGHLHFFDENFFITWLKKNGFEVLSVVYSTDFEISKSGLVYKVIQLIRRWLGFFVGPSVAMWLFGGYSLGVLVRSREITN